MARQVDKKKTRKALRRLKQVAERAHANQTTKLTNWEKDFLSGVSERLETYGSAFRDPAKGALEEALSQRQIQVVRVLDRKSRPKSPDKAATEVKPKKGLTRKSPLRPGQTGVKQSAKRGKSADRGANQPRTRDIHDDLPGKGAIRIVRGGRMNSAPGPKSGAHKHDFDE